MNYIVYFYSRVRGIEELAGCKMNDEISEEKVFELIREKKVNVMIQHASNGISYCHIDDLNHRFQQR